jgi:hypothetical protein
VLSVVIGHTAAKRTQRQIEHELRKKRACLGAWEFWAEIREKPQV